jgi:hypothetical protein
MQKPLSTPEGTPRNNRTLSPQEQRDKDRRKVNCDGFTYVPMVGWYCRRAQTRRNNEGNLK